MSKTVKTTKLTWTVVDVTWHRDAPAQVRQVLSEHRSFGAAMAEAAVVRQGRRGDDRYSASVPNNMCGIDVVRVERPVQS